MPVLWKRANGTKKSNRGIYERTKHRNKKTYAGYCIDEPGAGSACHEYKVTSALGDQNPPYAVVHFQNGPVKEVGQKGCFQEDLIAICIDRLQSFQKGNFACRENALAITKLEEALLWLRKRTMDREARGVEGTSQK